MLKTQVNPLCSAHKPLKPQKPPDSPLSPGKPRNVKKVQDMRDIARYIGDIWEVVPMSIQSFIVYPLRSGVTLRVRPYQPSHIYQP